jgi:hypothetical protein
MLDVVNVIEFVFNPDVTMAPGGNAQEYLVAPLTGAIE